MQRQKFSDPFANNIWQVSESQERKKYIKTKDILLVIYSADWCGPCKVFKKSKLPKIANNFPNVNFLINDIEIDPSDENDKISSVPTAILYFEQKKLKIYRFLFDQDDEINSDLFELTNRI